MLSRKLVSTMIFPHVGVGRSWSCYNPISIILTMVRSFTYKGCFIVELSHITPEAVRFLVGHQVDDIGPTSLGKSL